MTKVFIASALFTLGCFSFAFAHNNPPDLNTLLKRAEAGDAKAEYELYYYDEFNIDHAEDWLQKSADQGYPDAERALGTIYDTNNNFQEAEKWLLKAAQQGDGRSQYYLGDLFYGRGRNVLGDGYDKSGKPLPRIAIDNAKAIKWLLKSADSGFALAWGKLGEYYEQGKGVKQNYVEAYKWYSLALGSSDQKMVNYFTKGKTSIEKRLSLAQLAEARKRADEWLTDFHQNHPIK